MSTTNTAKVTIHCLAYDRLVSRVGNDYGRLVLMVPAGTNDDATAENAFTATNSPHEVPEIVEKTGCTYSMSVGDIVEIGDNFLVCDDVGYIPVTRSEFERLLELHQRAIADGGTYNIHHHAEAA